MYSFSLAATLDKIAPGRKYTSQEVEDILKALSPGFTFTGNELVIKGDIYEVPSDTGAHIKGLERYSLYLRSELLFCAGVLAACKLGGEGYAKTKFGAHFAASTWILNHPELTADAILRATAVLLGYRDFEKKHPLEGDTLEMLYITVDRMGPELSVVEDTNEREDDDTGL